MKVLYCLYIMALPYTLFKWRGGKVNAPIQTQTFGHPYLVQLDNAPPVPAHLASPQGTFISQITHATERTKTHTHACTLTLTRTCKHKYLVERGKRALVVLRQLMLY